VANPKQNRQKKPRKDWRRVVVAALAAFLALIMLLPMFTMVLEAAQAADTSALEQQIKEYQQRQAELAAQIKDLDQQLKAIAGDKAQALEQKRLLDQQISAKVQEIQSTESIIAQYDALIADEQAKLEDTQAKEEIQYELFCKRVRAMEEAGTVSYWSILFDSTCWTGPPLSVRSWRPTTRSWTIWPPCAGASRRRRPSWRPAGPISRPSGMRWWPRRRSWTPRRRTPPRWSRRFRARSRSTSPAGTP